MPKKQKKETKNVIVPKIEKGFSYLPSAWLPSIKAPEPEIVKDYKKNLPGVLNPEVISKKGRNNLIGRVIGSVEIPKGINEKEIFYKIDQNYVEVATGKKYFKERKRKNYSIISAVAHGLRKGIYDIHIEPGKTRVIFYNGKVEIIQPKTE